jgi:hypothetical protein
MLEQFASQKTGFTPRGQENPAPGEMKWSNAVLAPLK